MKTGLRGRDGSPLQTGGGVKGAMIPDRLRLVQGQSKEKIGGPDSVGGCGLVPAGLQVRGSPLSLTLPHGGGRELDAGGP